MKVKTKKLDIRRNVSLRMLNTLRLKAVAPRLFVAHSIDDLCVFMRSYLRGDFYLLGAGSNILINCDILNKPVITLGEEFSYIERIDSLRLEVGAATSLSKAIFYTMEENLKGLEELTGIPASIGGMTAINASSFGKEISSIIEEVTVIDRAGNLRHFKRDEINFSYRSSSLKEYIIVGIVVRLKKAEGVKGSASDYLKMRLNSQDFIYPNAGCIFNNPPNLSAGYLIDKCGLKGFRIGGAQVSLKHGNFIVNRFEAKAQDIDYIIRVIKERISERFAISLEEEIVRWEN